MRPRGWGPGAALAVFCAASAGCGREPSTDGLVARAGDHVLTVDHAAALMATDAAVPARIDVSEALASLWVDLTLLADAVARDSTLSQVDLAPVIRLRLEQEIGFAVQDTLIPRDTLIDEDELRRRYAEDDPDVRLSASHILLKVPVGATPEQKDSVRARIQEIRKMAVAGEDFATLARRYSQDSGTAPQGGDLGSFNRGTLVAPLDEAAMRLPVGQVSEPIETPFGIHLLQVTSREVTGFEEGRAAFRATLVSAMRARSDSMFWDTLVARADPHVEDGAAARTRELAAAPSERLPWWGRGQHLVSYEGGALTAEEVRLLLQARPLDFRKALVAADSAAVDTVLMEFTRRELLLDWARDRFGLRPQRAQVDSMVRLARGQIVDMAAGMGLRLPPDTPRTQRATAVDSVVDEALKRVIARQADPVPLGQVSFRLREGVPSAIYEDGVGRIPGALERIRQEGVAGGA